MVQALRSARTVRLSGLALGAAALAATGLLAGGNPSHAPGSSATASAAASVAASTTTLATRRAGPLHGVRRYLRTRQGVARVTLLNEATGRTYLLSGGPDTQYTASIVKADIMALWLWRYQSRTGTGPGQHAVLHRYLLAGT